MVAMTFIENPDNKPYVNHINGIRYDNNVENLEWVTQSENENHFHSVLGNTMRGKTYPRKVKWSESGHISDSMNQVIAELGTGCIEGLKKAIYAGRPYHGYTFEFI